MSNLLNRPDRSLFVRLKGTILIQLVIISIGLWTHNNSRSEQTLLLSRIGMDYEFLHDGRLWHLLTGTWFQSKPGIALSMIVLVLSGTAVLEYLVGTKRMLATVISGDWIATTLTLLTIRIWAGMGSHVAYGLLSVPDSGTSALAHAGLGATAVLMPSKWRRWSISAMIVFTLSQFLVETPTPALVHCWAGIYGGLIGWFVLRPGLAKVDEKSGGDLPVHSPVAS